MPDLWEEKNITIISNRNRVEIRVNRILYVLSVGKKVEIHVFGGKVYDTRMSLAELQTLLGDGFLKVHRGCIVAVKAVHDVSDRIILVNGETLEFTARKKKQILELLHSKRKHIISSFSGDGAPGTEEEYREYYSGFYNLPFAFTDIEMVFNEKSQAVDWIFRYGNPALAKLEKLPLERLIGSSFRSLFSNMDSKWLRGYERAALYGEVLEMLDYSPEIDTFLKVICFPTFKGHCGCILFDVSEIRFSRTSSDCDRVLAFYMGNMLQKGRN